MFKVLPPEPPEEAKPKVEDFVGQKVEPTPEPSDEPELTESFVLDIRMDDITIAELKKLLGDKKYLRREILGVLIDQEIRGKNRKTALRLLRDEVDKLL